MKHTVRLGLRENLAQFSLLVLVNAFVGAMVGVERSIRPAIYLGVGLVVLGTLRSVFAVRETRHHATHESELAGAAAHDTLSPREVMTRTSFTDRALSSVSQAGMVNNLNDGMAWGLFALVFAAAQMSLAEVGTLAAIYPAVWGLGRLFTGAWSDRIGRKGRIVAGIWTQAAGIVVIVLGPLDALVERAEGLNPDALLVTARGKGGGRSGQAAALLRELGFRSVRSLCGGSATWLAQRPLSRQGAR